MRAIVVCFAVFLVGLVAVLGLRLDRGPVAAGSPLLGRAAPSFDLPRIDSGGRISSALLEGRIVVVNFWASWCVPCRTENPVLDRFYEARQTDVEVVGILYGDDRGPALDFRREEGGSWPLVDDPDGRTAINFGTRGVPETFVIDARGTVTARLIGAVTSLSLERAVANARLGGPPVTARTDDYRTRAG